MFGHVLENAKINLATNFDRLERKKEEVGRGN